MNNFLIWWRAVFLDYPYWRVEYEENRPDGTTEQTHLLYYDEAKGLSEVYNGRKYIDYQAVKTYNNEKNN